MRRRGPPFHHQPGSQHDRRNNAFPRTRFASDRRAAIILAGCQKNSEPATAADLSGEYAAPAVEAPAATAGVHQGCGVAEPGAGEERGADDTVFVFARPPRARACRCDRAPAVKDLPTTVVLDDSHGMSRR